MLKGDYTPWPVVDGDGTVLNWMERGSELLGEEVEVHAKLDAELNIEEMDSEEQVDPEKMGCGKDVPKLGGH